MATKYGKLPPLVEQIKPDGINDFNDCWAAALSSWMQVNRVWHYTSGQLVDKYQQYLDLHLVLKDELFAKVADDINVKMAFEKIKNGSDLTSDYLAERLTIGHVYLGYEVTVMLGHVVVVYGVGHPTGKEEMISVMDPWYPIYRNIPLREFKSKRIVVGWKYAPFSELKGQGYW